jgi:hypothetical protein
LIGGQGRTVAQGDFQKAISPRMLHRSFTELKENKHLSPMDCPCGCFRASPCLFRGEYLPCLKPTSMFAPLVIVTCRAISKKQSHHGFFTEASLN